MVSCDSSVETVLLEDDILKGMGNDSGIKKLLLLVLAVVIVIALWRTLWYLAGVAIFIFVVYFVYEMLKDKL
jgi:uncharacterized membrane protein